METRFQPTRAPASDRSGFTLMEILVAMTVLTLMLLMVNQLLNSAAAVMTVSGRRLDADTQARLIFNRMSVDFAGMLKRTDVDYGTFKQPSNLQTLPLPNGNDQLAFYSETHGYFSGATQPLATGKADLALVAYMVANDPISGTPVLQRLGKGLGWTPDSSGSPAWTCAVYLPITMVSGGFARWPTLFSTTTPDPDYRSVGDLVFRMEYTYLLKATATQPATLSITPYNGTTGHTSINGFKDVAALVVTIAMLDNSSRQLMTSYTNLISSFPDAVNGATPATAWNGVVNSSTFAATANIPPKAASAVHIYERYFYLDSPY